MVDSVDNPEQGMTQAEYARHRGCSRQMVSKLKKAGRLVFAPGGGVDAEATDALLLATDDPVRGGRNAEPLTSTDRDSSGSPEPAASADCEADSIGAHGADIDLREAMRRERVARAKLAELELGLESGELVRVQQVERRVFTMARQALERLRSVPSRLRNSLASATDPRECERLLDEEVQAICAELQTAAAAERSGAGVMEAA